MRSLVNGGRRAGGFLSKAITVIALTLAFVLCVPGTGFIPGSVGIVEVEAAVKLNVKKLVLAPGKTYTIAISGSKKDFTWTSGNKSVATVKAESKAYKAVITGVSEGVTTVTAKNGSKSYECTVVISKEAEAPEAYGDTLSSTGSFKDITVYESSGKNTIYRTKKSLSAAKDMKLKNDDYIATASKGLMRLCMDDDEFVYIGESSEAVVSKGWFSKSKVVLVKGEMIAEVQKHLEDGESLTIQTPNTSMAIRGTVVAVKSTINKKTKKVTTVNYVLEGSAKVTYKDKKGKTQTVTLKAGEGMKVQSSAKGKTTSKKTADFSAFKLTGIDTGKLKGAGGPVVIDTGSKDDTATPAEVVYSITGAKATIPNVTKTESAAYVGKYWGVTGYEEMTDEEAEDYYSMLYPSGYPDPPEYGYKKPIEGWITYDKDGFVGYIFNTAGQGIPVYFVSGDSVDIYTSGSLFSGGCWIKLSANGKGSYGFDAKMDMIASGGYTRPNVAVSGTGYARYIDKIDWESVVGGLGGSESYMYRAVGNKATLKKGVWLAPTIDGGRADQSPSPFIVVVGDP